jgi:hypothetical protein
MRRRFVHFVALLALVAVVAFVVSERSAYASPEAPLDEPDVAASMESGERGLDWAAIGWCTAGVLGSAALLVAYAYVPGWWRRRKLRKGHAYGRGDTARAARSAKSRAEAERDVLSRKCACGAKLVGPLAESSWSTVMLGETTVTVARAPCPCGAAVRRYYLLPDAPEAPETPDA